MSETQLWIVWIAVFAAVFVAGLNLWPRVFGWIDGLVDWMERKRK